MSRTFSSILAVVAFGISTTVPAEVESADRYGTGTGDPCPHLHPTSVPPEFLELCRPQPVTGAERQAILRSLPTDGEVREFRTAAQKKISALASVLGFHHRDGIYEIKVIDLPIAATALHGRAVLLITRPALNLLTEGELQALAAHEVGHEYVWEEFAAAKLRKDAARLRQLELVCDIVAAQTLDRLGISTGRLLAAVQKVFDYNRAHLGTASNELDYPKTSERQATIRSWTASTRNSRNAHQ